jgi:hypothetical protein
MSAMIALTARRSCFEERRRDFDVIHPHPVIPEWF